MYSFYWLMLYLFLWVVYVRRRHYGFTSFIVSCFAYAKLIIDSYYKVIHNMYLLFSVVLLSTLATDR